ETASRWLFDYVQKKILGESKAAYVVDNVRNAEQLQFFRQHATWRVVHVHLYARDETLESRFLKRRKNDDPAKTHDEADLIKKEKDIESFKADADVRINTDRTD